MGYKNKEDLALAQKRHRTRNKARLREYLVDKKCVDCGTDDYRVFEFDHVRGEKKQNISRMVTGMHYSWNRIMQEINKCVIRCANCHRIKSFDQMSWSK